MSASGSSRARLRPCLNRAWGAFAKFLNQAWPASAAGGSPGPTSSPPMPSSRPWRFVSARMGWTSGAGQKWINHILAHPAMRQWESAALLVVERKVARDGTGKSAGGFLDLDQRHASRVSRSAVLGQETTTLVARGAPPSLHRRTPRSEPRGPSGAAGGDHAERKPGSEAPRIVLATRHGRASVRSASAGEAEFCAPMRAWLLLVEEMRPLG